MKSNYVRLSMIAIACLLIAPVAIQAQNEKEKEKSEKKEVEQIIITRKGSDKEKVTIQVDGDNVTVNGKPVEDLKDGNITVKRNKYKAGDHAMAYSFPEGNWNFNWNDGDGMFYNENENMAMLGVVTEKTEGGVEITDITEGSGAEKAGLKEEDVITNVDDKKIEDPDDLTKIIRSHKPGDKVNITYLRDKKENKLTAELGKWKGSGFNALTKMPNMDWNVIAPKIHTVPKIKTAPGQYYSFPDNRPRLGLSVQDTEDGKGVKVVDVDDDGNGQKAGVKEDDVIIAVNDKEVNSADEVAKIVRENREKTSIMLKIKRNGKIQNVEVKMPRKLKTADL